MLVDCDRVDGNDGCKGGDMEAAYTWIQSGNPLDTELSYEYTGRDDKECSASGKGPGVVKGFKKVPHMDADALKAAVMIGPVSIAVEADKETF